MRERCIHMHRGEAERGRDRIPWMRGWVSQTMRSRPQVRSRVRHLTTQAPLNSVVFYMLLFLVILLSHIHWLPSISWNVVREHFPGLKMHSFTCAQENKSPHVHSPSWLLTIWQWLSLQENVEGESLFLDLQCVCPNANFEQKNNLFGSRCLQTFTYQKGFSLPY